MFSELTAETLAEVAAQASVQQYQAGDMIVWQGQPSGSVYVIERGIASVTRLGPSKQATTLAYLMPGQSFGEVGILENQPRSASIAALTDIQVLAFEREDFLRILHRYSAVAIGLARILGAYLVDANRRHLHGATESRLILLFDLGAEGADRRAWPSLGGNAWSQSRPADRLHGVSRPSTIGGCSRCWHHSGHLSARGWVRHCACACAGIHFPPPCARHC